MSQATTNQTLEYLGLTEDQFTFQQIGIALLRKTQDLSERVRQFVVEAKGGYDWTAYKRDQRSRGDFNPFQNLLAYQEQQRKQKSPSRRNRKPSQRFPIQRHTSNQRTPRSRSICGWRDKGWVKRRRKPRLSIFPYRWTTGRTKTILPRLEPPKRGRSPSLESNHDRRNSNTH